MRAATVRSGISEARWSSLRGGRQLPERTPQDRGPSRCASAVLRWWWNFGIDAGHSQECLRCSQLSTARSRLEKVASSSSSKTIKVSSKSCRYGGGSPPRRIIHVDHAESTGSIFSCQENRVCVPDHPDVPGIPGVRSRGGEFSVEVVARKCRFRQIRNGLIWHVVFRKSVSWRTG
jgi:hypothetical protein